MTIGADETAGELRARMAEVGADLMVKALERLEAGTLTCTAQPGEGATYAAKIDKSETRIDWSRPAAELHNQIRGLSPSPGAWCEFPRASGYERVKILRSRPAEGTGKPGTILSADPLVIASGDGALAPVELQRAGKKPVAAAAFLRGARMAVGEELP